MRRKKITILKLWLLEFDFFVPCYPLVFKKVIYTDLNPLLSITYWLVPLLHFSLETAAVEQWNYIYCYLAIASVPPSIVSCHSSYTTIITNTLPLHSTSPWCLPTDVRAECGMWVASGTIICGLLSLIALRHVELHNGRRARESQGGRKGGKGVKYWGIAFKIKIKGVYRSDVRPKVITKHTRLIYGTDHVNLFFQSVTCVVGAWNNASLIGEIIMLSESLCYQYVNIF